MHKKTFAIVRAKIISEKRTEGRGKSQREEERMRKGANYRSEEDSPFAHRVLLAGGKEGKKGAWGGQQGEKEKKYVVQAQKKTPAVRARTPLLRLLLLLLPHTHALYPYHARQQGWKKRGGTPPNKDEG